MDPKYFLPLVVLSFGLLLEIGVFAIIIRQGQGFGPRNIRMVGIIAVLVLTCTLVLARGSGLEPAMAMLGAVAGYLFSFSEKKVTDKQP